MDPTITLKEGSPPSLEGHSLTDGVRRVPAPWANIPSSAQELSARILNQNRKLLHAAQLIASAIERLAPKLEFGLNQPRALIVGGFVRDSLMGLKPKDLDLEVYGVSNEALQKTLQSLFPRRVAVVGKSFGILKVALGSGLDLDISIPRRDSTQRELQHGGQINGDPSLSIAEAAARRDFTCNALAACPRSGEIIDCHNGLDDLRSGLLRVTDPTLFQDDPLRVYRAAQFIARFNFQIDDASFLLMREMCDNNRLNALPSERVTEELKKLLVKGVMPSHGLELLSRLGCFAKHMPEVHALNGVPQNPEWHPEGCVWTHTKMVIDRASELVRARGDTLSEEERLIVLFGALAHDFGKPEKTEFIDGRFRSRGHELAGVEPARNFLSRLVLPQTVKDGVLLCTEYHMRPGEISRAVSSTQITPAQATQQTLRLIKKIAPLSLETFLTLTEADSRGRGLPGVETSAYGPGELLRSIAQAHQLEHIARTPLVRGRDLIHVGLPPSDRFRTIINEIETARECGKIETFEAAMQLVRQKYLLTGSDLKDLKYDDESRYGSLFKAYRAAVNRGEIKNRNDALAFARSCMTSAPNE